MGGAVSVTADNKSANCDEMSRNLSTKRSAKGQSKRVPDRSMRMSCRIQR